MSSGDAKRNQFSHPWTNAEVLKLQTLVENAERAMGGRLKKGEVAKILAFFPDRSRHSVEQQISILGRGENWEKKSFRPWTAEEELKLRDLYTGDKWRIEASKNFPDRDPRDVREKARLMGLSRRILKTKGKRLSKLQKGMMAGLLMSDGCLSHRIAGQGRKQHLNTLGFTNIDPDITELFASMVTNCRVHLYQMKGGFQKKRKPVYECSINSRQAVKSVLVQVLPYLVGYKLRQAKEMLVCLNGGHQGVSVEVTEVSEVKNSEVA